MKSKNNSFFWSRAYFLYYLTSVFCFLIFKTSSSSCCETFLNGACIQCPLGMHLYMSNCIFDLPNCLRYAGGFYCIQCSSSFNLTNSNTCIPSMEINFTSFPTTNYSKLSKNYILNDGNSQQIIMYLANAIDIGYNDIEDYIIAAFYQKVSQPKELELFRFIFQTKTGFMDVFLYYISANQLINIVNKTQFLINNQSNSYVYLYYNIQSDPIYELIQMQLDQNQQFKGLPISNFTLIDSYKANNPEINQYKLYYLNNNVGLVSIKFELSVDGNQTNDINNDVNNSQNLTQGSINNDNATNPVSSNKTINSNNNANNNNNNISMNNSKPTTNNSSQSAIVIPNFIDKQIPIKNISTIQEFSIGEMIAFDSYGSNLRPTRLFIRSFLNLTYMHQLNISLDPNQTIYGIDFEQTNVSNLTIIKQQKNNQASNKTDEQVVSVDNIKYFQFLYSIKRNNGDFVLLGWKQIFPNSTQNNSSVGSKSNNQTISSNNKTNNTNTNGNNQTSNVTNQLKNLLNVTYSTISLLQYQNHTFFNRVQAFLKGERPIINPANNVNLIQVDVVDVWVNNSETNLNKTSFYQIGNNSTIKIPLNAKIFTMFRLTYSLNQLLPYQIILSVNHNTSQILILYEIGQFNTSNSTSLQNNQASTSTTDPKSSNSNGLVIVDSTKFTQDQLITQITNLLMAIYPNLLSSTVLSNVSYIQYPNDYTPPLIKDPIISAIQVKNKFPSTYREYTLVFSPLINKNNTSYSFKVQYKNNQIDFLKIPPQANPQIDTSQSSSSSSDTNSSTSSNTNNSSTIIKNTTNTNINNNSTTKNDTATNSATDNPSSNTSTKTNSTNNNTNTNNNFSNFINSSQVVIPQGQYITNKTIIQLNKLLKSLYSNIKNLQLQYVTFESSNVGQIYQLWYQNDLNVYGYRVGVNVQGVVSLYKIYKQPNIGQINAKVAAISVQVTTNANSNSTALNSSKTNSNLNKTNINSHPIVDNSSNNKSIVFIALTFKVTQLNPQQFKSQKYYNQIIMFLSIIDDSIFNRIVLKVYKNQTLIDPAFPNGKNITYLIYFASNSIKQGAKGVNSNNIYEIMYEVANNQMLILSINQDNEKLYQAQMKLNKLNQDQSTKNTSSNLLVKQNIDQNNQSSQTKISNNSIASNLNDSNSVSFSTNKSIDNKNETFLSKNGTSIISNSSDINNNGGAVLIVDNNQTKKVQQHKNLMNTTSKNQQNISQFQSLIEKNKKEQFQQLESQIMIQIQKIMVQNKETIQKEKSIISHYLIMKYRSFESSQINSYLLNQSAVIDVSINLLTWEDLQHKDKYKYLNVFMHKLKSMVMCTFLYVYQAKQNMTINDSTITSQNSINNLKKHYNQLTYFGICSSSNDISHLKTIYEISYKDQQKLYILNNITSFDSLTSETKNNNQTVKFINSSDTYVQNSANIKIEKNVTSFANENQTQAFCQQFQTVYFFNSQSTNKNVSKIPVTNSQLFNISNFYQLLKQLQNSSEIQQSTSNSQEPSSFNKAKGSYVSFTPSLRTQSDTQPKGMQLLISQPMKNQALIILMVKSKSIGQQNIYLTYNLNKTDNRNQTLSMVQIHQIRNGEFIIEFNQILSQIQVQGSIVDTQNCSTITHNYFIKNKKTYHQSKSTLGKIFVPLETALKDMYYLASQQYAMYYYKDLLKDAELFEIYFDLVSIQDNPSDNLASLQNYLNMNALKLVFHSIYLVVNQSGQISNNTIGKNSYNSSNNEIIVDVYMITTAYNQSTRRFDVNAIKKLETINIQKVLYISDQNCLIYDQNNSSLCLKCKDRYSMDNLNQIQQNNQIDPLFKQFISNKCYKTVLNCGYQVWEICLMCKTGYVLTEDFKVCFKKVS